MGVFEEMTHQCEIRKNLYFRNWVKGVLALNIAEKSVAETFEEEIQNLNREKIFFNMRDRSNCKHTCSAKKINESPRHVENKIFKTHWNTMATSWQNRRTIGHDAFCRIRQLRNTLLHPSTMKLDEDACEKYINSVLSILEKDEFKENINTRQTVKKVNQMKQGGYVVTSHDEIAACVIAKEYLGKRTNEIEEEIDSIIDVDVMKKTTCHQLHNMLTALMCKVYQMLTTALSQDVKETETRRNLRNIEIELDVLENMLLRIQRMQQRLMIKTQEECCRDRSCDNFLHMTQHNAENNLQGPGLAGDRDKLSLKACGNTNVSDENISQNIVQLSLSCMELYMINLAKFSLRCTLKYNSVDICPFTSHPRNNPVYCAELMTSACILYSESIPFSYEMTSLISTVCFNRFNCNVCILCSSAHNLCTKIETKCCNTCHITECRNHLLFMCSHKSVLSSLVRYWTHTCCLRRNEMLKHEHSLSYHYPFLTHYVKASETDENYVDLKDAFNPNHGLIVNECLLHILSSPNSCGYLELEIGNIKNFYISTLNGTSIISVKIFLAWLKRTTFTSLENKTVDKGNFIDFWYFVFSKQLLHSSYLKVIGNSSDCSQKFKDIRLDNGPEVSLHSPAYTNVNTESREILDTQHNTTSQEMRDDSNPHHTNGNESVVQFKLVYGTVDLKSQRASRDSENQDDSLKKDDEKIDLVKNTISNGLAYIDMSTDIITAPVFSDQSQNKKPIKKSDHNRSDVASSGEADLSSIVEHEKSEDNNKNIVSSTDDNISTQVSDIYDEVSAEGHTSLGASGYTPLEEHPKTTNTSRSEHTYQLDSALSLPLRSKEIEIVVPTAACDTEGSSSYCTGQLTVNHPSNLPNSEIDHEEIQRFEPLVQIIDKIADGERVPPQITMRYEMLRFCTLRSYPKENKPFITRLAQAGFYYANSGDEVVCYTCARRKSNWREDDVPMDIHRQLNPNCGFLLRNSEVNVPIRLSDRLLENSTIPAYHQTLQNGNATTTASTPNATSQNTLKRLYQATVQTSLSSSNTFQMATQNNTGLVSSTSIDTASSNRMPSRPHGNFVQTVETSAIALTLQSHHTAVSSSTFGPSSDGSLTPASQNAAEGTNRSAMPKYPKYASKTVRVTSFNDCGDIVVQPDSLADSGFFYAGFGDCVRCFQCGVGLRHWSEEDDPWIEHSRWSKDCAFVRQVKGQEFVNLVQMAVQYSQNQSEQTPGESTSTTGTNQEATANGDIENLMHTDAAQSVLEMGYNPNVIRRAIRAIREINDQEELTAVNVMEKIFALEEADNSVNSPQDLEPLQQSITTQSSRVRSELPSVGTNANNSTTRSQTTAEINRTASSNAPSAQSAVTEDMPSVSTLPGGPEMMSRAHKKSQLLEQKKLKEENEKLKQQSICTKCHQNDVCIVFLPCGHLVTCETCAPTVRYCTVQECGKYIKGTVRTYLS